MVTHARDAVLITVLSLKGLKANRTHKRLRELLVEFTERTKTESLKGVVEGMLSRTREQEEGEPEQAWRAFCRAMLRGRRAEIEPMIQEHPDSDILWAGPYPEDVALTLNEIAESYPVTQIAGSVAEGNVTIITPDFGPVGVKLIDGKWRVDATKVIEGRRTVQDLAESRDVCDGSAAPRNGQSKR